MGALVSRAKLMEKRVGQRRLSEHPAHSCSRTVPAPVPKLSLAVDSSMCLPLKACSAQKEMCPFSLVRQKNEFYCTYNSYFFFPFHLIMILESRWGPIFQNTK